MFFIILGKYTRWTFVIFSLVQRILLLIFPCHTVTHGTDLRRSPQGPQVSWVVFVRQLVNLSCCCGQIIIDDFPS